MSPICTDAQQTPEPLSRADATFDTVVLPHLGDARRLARWLVGNDDDADDAVQEASLRALRYFGTFSGRNARAWFLTIVRHTCHASYVRTQRMAAADVFDEELHSAAQTEPDPESRVLQADAMMRVERALHDLPERPRALLILRELRGLSYQELADTLNVPKGTVMSGLCRARRELRLRIGRRSALSPAARRRDTSGAHGHPRITPKE